MDKPNTITMTLEIPIPVLPQVTELIRYVSELINTSKEKAEEECVVCKLAGSETGSEIEAVSRLKNQLAGEKDQLVTSVSSKVDQELEVQWPASAEEVAEYCAKRNSCINPEKFYEYYETRHWRTASGEVVRNWKAMVETWEAREYKHYPKKSTMEESYNMMKEWAVE